MKFLMSIALVTCILFFGPFASDVEADEDISDWFKNLNVFEIRY